MANTPKPWKFFSKQTLLLILAVCLVDTVFWIAFHGVPLIGLPKKDEVKSVTVAQENSITVEIAEKDKISLLLNAANLLNYRLFGQTEGEPAITVTYHLENGGEVVLAANSTTMWKGGKAHALKETETFVNIVEGLFLDPAR